MNSACETTVAPSFFTPSWWHKAVISAALLLAAAFFIIDLRHHASNTMATFYYAAGALKSGGDLYASHAPGVEPQYVYPPLFAVLMVPFAGWKLATLTRFWLIVNFVTTGVALWLGASEIARRFGLSRNHWNIAWLAASAFLLSAGEIKTEWSTSQTDMLVLIPFILGLIWAERRPGFAGVALALGGNIKYQPLFALPYFAFRRRWRAFFITILAAIAIALLPGCVIGWQRNLDYLARAFAGLGLFAGVPAQAAAHTVNLTWIRSVSITSTMGRLLLHEGLNPAKAFYASGLVALGVLALVWRLYQRQQLNLLAPRPGKSQGKEAEGMLTSIECVGLMVAWLAFGPEVSRRHMVVLMLLNLLCVAMIAAAGSGTNGLKLKLGLLFLQLGMRFPPSSLSAANHFWNGVGGPSWCLLAVYLLLVARGAAACREMAPSQLLHHEPGEAPIPRIQI